MTLDHKAAYLNAKMGGPPVIASVVGKIVCSSCVIASLCGAVTPRFGSRAYKGEASSNRLLDGCASVYCDVPARSVNRWTAV